ncbi:hypothetical protein FACS189426_15070 [Bacteroidia bacterium]|nr:hypothetical protein FACS189426_15070 [Bacteroidia bacterium]GHV70873.1 hypothetical protein FACS189420_3750 [Bacteroidia bacterium]
MGDLSVLLYVYLFLFLVMVGLLFLMLSFVVGIKKIAGKIVFVVGILCCIPFTYLCILNYDNSHWECLGPFFQSIEKKKYDKMKQLIEEGYDVNENNRCAYESTPLSYAVHKGDIRSVQLLVEHGADPNLEPNIGSTPLDEAIYKGDTAILNYLLDHGADVSLKTGSVNPIFPIEFATVNLSANKDIVEALINHGADVNVNNCEPLRGAIRNHNYEVVRCLLEHGAEADKHIEILRRQAIHTLEYLKEHKWYNDTLPAVKIIELLEEYAPKEVELPMDMKK